MALPKHLAHSLSPQELAFLAEQDTIEVVPLFSMSRVRLLSVSCRGVGRCYLRSDLIGRYHKGVYGPFNPPAKAQVPLWLAMSLKRKRKCRIVAPEWLNVGE